MTPDLRALSDQELAEHTLSLHGQLEAVQRERGRRWKVAEAGRAARGVAWCSTGEHEVPVADIIRGGGDYDDICGSHGEASRAAFDVAPFGHTASCPGGKVEGLTVPGCVVLCDWRGVGAQVLLADEPSCPRCEEPVEELRPAAGTSEWEAAQVARGADVGKLRELAAEIDEPTFNREVLGVCGCGYPASRKVHAGGEHCRPAGRIGEG